MKGALLLNLGSPNSTEIPDVREYLEEFLMDERVLDMKEWKRKLLLKLIILPKRPIATSRAQQKLVQEETEMPIFLAMRYANPSTADVVKEIKDAGVTDLLIIPLYPHYAMSSYESAVVKAMEELREQAPDIKTKLVQPFYNDPDYINALWESIKPQYEGTGAHLMMSFHGIPERHVKKSDPSHAHCLVTPNCCDTCHPAHHTCYRHQCISTKKTLLFHSNLAFSEIHGSRHIQISKSKD